MRYTLIHKFSYFLLAVGILLFHWTGYFWILDHVGESLLLQLVNPTLTLLLPLVVLILHRIFKTSFAKGERVMIGVHLCLYIALVYFYLFINLYSKVP